MFDLTLKIKGFPIDRARQRLQEIQALTPEQHREFVQTQRLKIVNYHLQHNPYYKSLLGRDSVDSWAQIPLLTKADLQRPLTERLSKGYPKNKVYVNKTSGSSGHPFIFAKDKFSHAMTWAYIIQSFGKYNLDFNHSYQARFYGIPLGFPGYQKERLKDLMSKRYRFPIFDLQDKELEKILKHFKIKRFEYINGYTSSIVLFAKFLKERGLVLNEICPSLRLCMVTSEMLFDSDKQLMEEVFGVPVVNEYGASELDLIAFTHPNGEFVLNSDTLFTEVVDEAGNPLPDGEVGKLVITSLFNKAHPFIRYEIGDIGVIKYNKNTNRYILKKLIGRTNDIAHLPSGKTVPGLTFYYVTKSVIEDSGKVKEFIVIQKALDQFEIQYVSASPLEESEKATMIKALETYLEPGLKLDFQHREVITRSARGKLKQFSSEYTP